MKTSKITQVVHTGTNDWKDKKLEKYLLVFENGDNGTLTKGFQGVEPAPEVGETLDYDIETTNFGTEIKLPRKAGSGGGFGGAKKWSAEQIAQQDAVKLTSSYIANGNDLKFWKAFFIEAKEFMIAQIKEEAKTDIKAELPANSPTPEPIDNGVKDDLPF